MRQLLPLVLSANTVAVMWLAGNKRALAWALGLVGQAGWLLFVLVFDAWGLLPLVVVLSVVYARNLWRWRSDSHEVSEPEVWLHMFPPSDPRHVHHTDAGGNCDNPDCGYNSDVAYFDSWGESEGRPRRDTMGR